MKRDRGARPAPARTITSSRRWSRPRWPATWPSAKGSGSRTTCSSASSGSPSGSTRSGPASFLFAFEESHGYQRGTHVRDKDAAVASLLFAELAATVKDRKRTVLEYLDDLYIDVGHYGERLINKYLEGREGVAQIKKLMAAFRTAPPKTVGGLTLTEVHDYKTHEIRVLGRARQDRAPCPNPRAT